MYSAATLGMKRLSSSRASSSWAAVAMYSAATLGMKQVVALTYKGLEVVLQCIVQRPWE